ncbi:unnamed protein product [Chrysodeixis includens]|uniref:THIF-type NAD/FAD binding fold domain-containing protein n=1 Tax=Chrysodeixis includens TaxID=689277 RepID=A0A9P0BZW1_CHRIL|nr:unnamed protein product [Chrysodeixis includens]
MSKMEQLLKLETEIRELRKVIQDKEEEMLKLRREVYDEQSNGVKNDDLQSVDHIQRIEVGQLPKWAIERYSRQILLREIGVKGQSRICQAKVLIVGAGGLGCPAGLYLAGAGVGEIGIIDYDLVELTNIHRQVLHFEHDENVNKAESAAATLRSINSRIKIKPYKVQLDSKNALAIAADYDVILDCTDNVPTRYLLSDLSCLVKRPLISGSALKMEGQLTIYGYRAENDDGKGNTYRGPCYRCVFPSPPSPDAVGSCSAHGVAGPVPGVIGTLQAMEALKYIVDMPARKLLVERMLIFDAEDMTTRTVRLRKRNVMCAACSDSPTITHLVDYEAYCMAPANDKKKQDNLKSERRRQEKEKRRKGQSYYGFRIQKEGERTTYIQDVLKQERMLGPPCKSEYCAKSTLRACKKLTEEDRRSIFSHFWDLQWVEKKKFVRSLIDSCPIKRRRASHVGKISRKGDSKSYHLIFNNERILVCRVMFLNTLGIKEAMVRCWLSDEKNKISKTPKMTHTVVNYIEKLPTFNIKCQSCISSGVNVKYIDLNVKNQFQLYSMFVKDMKIQGVVPASRKTFAKVLNSRNLRIFKPKNDRDVCDLVRQHNISFGYEDKCDSYFYNINNLNEQWS